MKKGRLWKTNEFAAGSAASCTKTCPCYPKAPHLHFGVCERIQQVVQQHLLALAREGIQLIHDKDYGLEAPAGSRGG